ncbi:MAG: ATP-dependent DNA helicase RecG, partial [Bdellovibrionales bacterium]|nr:ATP-dependent DNA helicase RecG [Bdellovibrionales bacterium]
MLEKKKKNTFLKALNPESRIQYLKGVGPRLAEVFAKKNIYTLHDLIHWYPRTYRDQRIVQHFSQLIPGSYVTMYGYVARKKVLKLRGRKTMYEMIIKTKGGWIACKYFRLPYRGYFDGMEIDQKVKVMGQVSYYRNHPEFHHPDIYPFKKDDEDQTDALIPVYTELEKVSQNKIRKMIATAFSSLRQNKEFLNSDPLPSWLRKENHLISKIVALERIHHPDQSQVEDYLQFRSPAQRRLIFEEFFFLQLYMGMKRAGLKKEQTYSIKPTSSLFEKLKKSLPFSLTAAQERVLKEIGRDLEKTQPMHRLIQGDVGCGKTIVALLSCCSVIENGLQSAIMAPTEILAEQHYKNALSLLKPLGINISLLTGKTRAREKRDILEKLVSGYTSLCIGTHALIQESVQFKKLGFVIIDEQHRFGVHQRGLLKEKGIHPHFLVMTATPIPRSLAMTLYGDLDVSVIDEMPKGRKPVVTKKTYPSNRDKVWKFLESQVQSGRQAYIVYPLVEESEHIDLKNAVEEYEKLKQRFSDFTLGLLHGRLSFFEKQEVMSAFLKGEVQILVSTTVIEVGVDVSNASMMIVEHADRFGLSQLHQLRGRV